MSHFGGFRRSGAQFRLFSMLFFYIILLGAPTSRPAGRALIWSRGFKWTLTRTDEPPAFMGRGY